MGIASDGCAFDTLEITHKECFCPTTIKIWSPQAVSKDGREAHEFVNLYAKWRGINRWPGPLAQEGPLGAWDLTEGDGR